MSSPDNFQKRISKIHEATRRRGEGIETRDPLVVVDAILSEAREKGASQISGIVTVAIKELEFAFLKQGVKEKQEGEGVGQVMARYDMTDLLQSLQELVGKSDAETLASLNALKERLADHRHRL